MTWASRKMLQILVACSTFGLSLSVAPAATDPLASGFNNPPEAARPQAWWHWINGNITKPGITADLEAMKHIGLGGATIVNVDCDVPRGTVNFMSPQWRDDFKFAVQEANRLGLVLCVENCAGWSSSGGPWNTPAHAMQCLTSTETRFAGPVAFNGVLKQPSTKLGTYHDIAVLAFKDRSPKVSSTDRAATKLQKLVVRKATYQTMDDGTSTDVTAKIIARIDAGKKSVEVKNDLLGGDPAPGQAKQLLLQFTLGSKLETLAVDEGETLTFPTNAAELAQARSHIKSAVDRTFVRPPEADAAASELPIPLGGVIDLTSHLAADGHLSWAAPAGNWTVIRIGYTPIGIDNHPAPAEGTGLECDKFSKAALDAHWDGFMAKVLADIGPLAGKTLNASLIDSYEVGLQDWTGNFRAEFQKRRGYDPLKYLIAFNRYVVDSPAVTDRFLWDMRRTVADLFAENYYAHFNELCHAHGLSSAIEPYTGPFESLQCGQPADTVMGEFWTGTDGDPSIKLASSVAHIYGKTIVGAESFTAADDGSRWMDDPYALKTLGDLMYCRGLNRYTFHRYAMQPWMNRFPGMTMGPYGLNFERTITWWGQGNGWIDYLTRCQFLLQQGRAVADVAYFTGETAPVEMPTCKPTAPVGYDYDAVDADVLLHGARVSDGRITLASGASYAVLVLPDNDRTMSPAMLDGIRALVRAGATVLGPRPQRAPGLTDYPNCDTKVQTIATDLWGPAGDTAAQQHALGQGRVVSNTSLENVFAAEALKPDFEFHGTPAAARLTYAHRIAGTSDIYFVSNQQRENVSADCTFRLHGKTPRLFHPDTGAIEPAPVWDETGRRTTVTLNFAPAGSVFVVFEPEANPAVHGVSVEQSGLSRLAIRHAVYSAVDGNGAVDVTAKLASLVHDDRLSVVVDNDALGPDPAHDRKKKLVVDYSLDGTPAHEETPEHATLTLPVSDVPGWDLSTVAGEPMTATTWSAGRLDLRQSDGTLRREAVDRVPAATEVTGPWTLEFPPHWGAPASVPLAKLMSWTDHPDAGVRYFSGTATYRKRIAIDAAQLAPGRELWLDLGTVKNFAQVILNGHNQGTLWKPPFRVNVTAAAHPGMNELVIKITNLWPNRLIGDEQLLPDVQWVGDRLKAWPQWLLDGKPSPTGRYTFTTWHHWKKGDALLESGLIGPVELRTAVVVPVR